MQAFYNKQGIGDVLLIALKQGDRHSIKEERFGDVVRISDKDGLVGYNLFQASEYLKITTAGKVQVDEEFASSIRDIFKQNKLDDAFDVDLTPKFVVGYVKQKEKHSNADKLSVCQVDLGDEAVQIVCGAPNVDAGQKVVVAKVGAIMPSGLEIKAGNLRGEDSFGMICSQKELGLPNAPEEKGIYVLDDSYEVGQAFKF
ncbi:YtpR family tRNA-binding protein [Terribacillus sp. 179-K 1B1 HS]|uniref:YtpR family tRNA-binding protein n=1 Tax=Terribacillus sp. 179-K 1B1 HS TaxID=3142388 RepID=UPI0039A32CDC